MSIPTAKTGRVEARRVPVCTRTRAVLSLVITLALTSSAVRAQKVDQAKVVKVKAAYLLNFVKYTEWPKSAFESEKSSIVIAVLGNDPFGSVLDAIVKGKTLHGRTVTVQRHNYPKSDPKRPKEFEKAKSKLVAKLKKSQLLFICDSEPLARAKALAKEIAKTAVLTVGDLSGFADDGGMLDLRLEGDRVVFYANRKAIKASGVEVGSRVLRSARLVGDDSR